MNPILKPLAWMLREIGTRSLLALLCLSFLLLALISIYSKSWLLTFIWAASITLVCIACVYLIFVEVGELKRYISKVSGGATKEDALIASDGFLIDVQKPLLSLISFLVRNQTCFNDLVREMRHSAAELSSNVTTLSANTSQQSDATSSTAAAVTQIGQSIDDVTDRINSVLNAAENVRGFGKEGEASVAGAQEAIRDVADLAKATGSQVNRLSEESKAVSTMSSDIVAIADQTSLLALNAAIEAARAGEHGRGFSVVADEVRALAERSQSSANVISEKIENVGAFMEKVERSMSGVLENVERCLSETNTVESKLNDISASSDDVSKQIGAIAVAAQQQSIAAKEISSHIEKVANNAEENSYMAKQSAEVSEYLVAVASKCIEGGMETAK